MKNQIPVLILVLGCLCLGVIIYATTRSDALILNHFIAPLVGHYLYLIRNFFSYVNFPHWIVYSLPDALWMLALSLVILMIWGFQINKRSMMWLFCALAFGLLFEIGQGLHLIQGTYDAVDLFSIFMGGTLPVIFILLKSRLWTL